MESYPEKDGYKNVVFSVNWRCNATEDNYSATNYGTVGLMLSSEIPFTDYKNLTNEQVSGWVKTALGDEQVSQIETGLAGEILAKKIPISIVNSLPWIDG